MGYISFVRSEITPHREMAALDDLKRRYRVSYTIPGHPIVHEATVVSHGEDWMVVEHKSFKGRKFINMRQVATLEIVHGNG